MYVRGTRKSFRYKNAWWATTWSEYWWPELAYTCPAKVIQVHSGTNAGTNDHRSQPFWEILCVKGPQAWCLQLASIQHLNRELTNAQVLNHPVTLCMSQWSKSQIPRSRGDEIYAHAITLQAMLAKAGCRRRKLRFREWFSEKRYG